MESPLLLIAFILLVVHVVVSSIGIAYSANLKECKGESQDDADARSKHKAMLIGGWSVSAAVCAISAVLVFIGMRKCGSSEADEE